jgi:hypothetical protein
MYANHSSLSAADFLRRLHMLVGGNLTHIQTDNGSEFHLHFEQAIKDLKLEHWWSRTKTPKDNAVCERFNRTLQEEFIEQGNAYPNPAIFNQKLTDWLIEYDFHRPHAALGYRRPIEIASEGSNVLPINPSRTITCIFRGDDADSASCVRIAAIRRRSAYPQGEGATAAKDVLLAALDRGRPTSRAQGDAHE